MGQSTTGAPPSKRAVLITGCSSGIGRESAVLAAENGWTVFAGVRREADAAKLRALGIPGLVPLFPLDLTSLEHIAGAAKTVAVELDRRGIPGLHALVNNAGGGKPAPVELMALDDFRRELQTRLLGSAAMAQSFLPLIRQAKGRIVWIMTPAMIPTPYVASIHACDFAVNCLARTLDIELKSWGIPNVMIRCGGIRTPAGLRTIPDVEACLRDGDPGRVGLYELALRGWAKSMEKFDVKRTDAGKVAEVVFEALSASKPKRRYSIGHMAKAAAFLEFLPQSLADRILRSRF
jgi:NAD(P)-dependent dehydrogenase (short-subunit alcohol dehydrogenase family)